MEHQRITCNCCGRISKTEENQEIEDFLYVKKSWGYFSHKDLQVHEFYMCESCYDKLVSSFEVPVYVHEKTEVMEEK